jgi:hypothetical protein
VRRINLTFNQVYYFGLFLLVIGMPLSVFLVSLSQFILVGNWIIEGFIDKGNGSFRNKLKMLQERKGIAVLISVILVHVIWLFNSYDFTYAFHDIQIKLPLLVLPLVLGTSKGLSKMQFKVLMQTFAISVTIGTLISTAILFHWISFPYKDIREISIFISHIRFSLLIVIAIYSLVYLAWSGNYFMSSLERKLHYLFAFWLLVFIFLLHSLTGIIILFLLLYLFAFLEARNVKRLAVMTSMLLFLLFVPVCCVLYVGHIVKEFYHVEKVEVSKLDKYTAEGNLYTHNLQDQRLENGHYVGLYLCEKELEKEWNKRSNLHYNDTDKYGQGVKYTLIRYLTSKGLKKDANGVKQLTAADIEAIQSGKANVIYLHSARFYNKIYETLWQIDVMRKGNNPSGHSVTQRILYLDAGWRISKEHFWFGVGTGDVKASFHEMYQRVNSPLTMQWRLRAHNQFLTFLLTFGIFGFLWIVFALFYPILCCHRLKDFFVLMFAIIAFLSFLNEDTLETAAGMTFFAFFYSLFVFGREEMYNLDRNNG